MALTLEASTRISAPADAVWRLLADPRGWRLWWPHCREARTADRKPLGDGSRLEITLRLRFLTFTLRPTVEIAQPARSLISAARSFGVTARHAYYLESKPSGCLLRQRVVLGGPGLLLFRLFGFDRATAAMFAENLKGLRRLAERGL